MGSDPHPEETKGVFNALIRLRDALLVYDLPQIERSVKELDDAMERVRSAQAESGARIQGLQSIQAQLDDEEIELRRALSQELDVDLVEAISNLTSRQIAFEASLRSMGMIFQLSLLNFI